MVFQDGKHAWMVKIGEKGQFVIPKEARELFDLQPGCEILVLGDEKRGLDILPKEMQNEYITRIFSELDDGKQVMGTVNNKMMILYKNCIRAFADTEYQVVMSVGNLVSVEDFGMLPENISVFQQVDQIAILKAADVFLSHCGMNSVSESLYFGVPLVIRLSRVVLPSGFTADSG